MTTPNDHDLLLKMSAQLNSFYEEFRRVSNGIGFPRCAERLARLEVVEKNHETLKARLWWVATFSISTLVGLVIMFLKG